MNFRILSIELSHHGPFAQLVQPEERLLLEGQMHVVQVHVSNFNTRIMIQIRQRSRVACVGFLSGLTVNGTGCVPLAVYHYAESVNRMLVRVGYLSVDKVQPGVVDGQHTVVGQMEDV